MPQYGSREDAVIISGGRTGFDETEPPHPSPGVAQPTRSPRAHPYACTHSPLFKPHPAADTSARARAETRWLLLSWGLVLRGLLLRWCPPSALYKLVSFVFFGVGFGNDIHPHAESKLLLSQQQQHFALSGTL